MQAQNILCLKRSYLSDYRPLVTAIYPQQIFVQLFKSATATSMQGFIKYNLYLDSSIKAAERGEHVADFDFKELINESRGAFWDNSKKFVVTSWILKCLEYVCTGFFSDRLADRLVKDLEKSLVRKVAKFSCLEASWRIFFTSLWGRSLTHLSNALYGCGVDCLQYYHFCRGCEIDDRIDEATSQLCFTFSPLKVARPKPITTRLQLLKAIYRRGEIHSLAWVTTATGYAVGSYISPSYGGVLGSATFDIVSYLVVGSWMEWF